MPFFFVVGVTESLKKEEKREMKIKK